MRRGYTVVELVIVLTIAGMLMAVAVPRIRLVLDRQSVRSAAAEVATILYSARALALAGQTAVAVDFDSAAGVVKVRRGPEIVSTRNLAQAHGIRLGRTRDSLSFDVHGLGHGAANLSVILRRGAAVETVFVSRMGRVR